jgi:hypothetical protein
MNHRRKLIAAAGLAIFVAVIVWVVIRMDVSVEVRLMPAGPVRPDDPTAQAEQIINDAAAWLVPAGLIGIFLVGGVFFVRELLRQRARDRQKPPN